jgi:hypothetical protein
VRSCYTAPMVRPDEAKRAAKPRSGVSGCIDLAGESPARVTAGGPGSRLPATAEMASAEAQRRKSPKRRKQAGGPQREVNAEQASSEYQPKGVRESRAGHATAKATDSARIEPERALDLPGVVAAARQHRSMWNRRDPSRRPTSGRSVAISAERERRRSRAGVRGGRSTDEGADKALEGRTPASVVPGKQVSVRAWS